MDLTETDDIDDDYKTPCQQPGWLEAQLAPHTPFVQAINRLHPRLLSDWAAPRARYLWRCPEDRENGCEPYVVAVEYSDCVCAYEWLDGTLAIASDEAFATVRDKLPKTVRKKKAWRTRYEHEAAQAWQAQLQEGEQIHPDIRRHLETQSK
jgi:hypothetical protein